jgi:NAD(P)-dependent dehydrogenase (short-subunit alcohol dehydrogenase family)
MNAPWTVRDIPDLAGKTAIVTGANSGIGFDEARALAAKGARVVLACRSEERGHSAAAQILREHPQAKAVPTPLDLADLASIRRFAAEFLSRFERLDILLNNAGIMMVPFGKTADGFERQFGTNHLGHFALTGLLLDGIRRTPRARVVTVSSNAHRRSGIDFDNLNAEKGYSRIGAYAQSKLANLLFTYELERRFEKARIDAIAVAAHPGFSATNLAPWPVARRFMPLLAQPSAMGALPELYAATAPDVRGGEYYGPGGPNEARGYPIRTRSNALSYDGGAAAKLWQVSEQLTGVHFLDRDEGGGNGRAK